MVHYYNHIPANMNSLAPLLFCLAYLAKAILVPVLRCLKITEKVIQLGQPVSYSQTSNGPNMEKSTVFLSKNDFLLLHSLEMIIALLVLIPQIPYLFSWIYSPLVTLPHSLHRPLKSSITPTRFHLPPTKSGHPPVCACSRQLPLLPSGAVDPESLPLLLAQSVSLPTGSFPNSLGPSPISFIFPNKTKQASVLVFCSM